MEQKILDLNVEVSFIIILFDQIEIEIYLMLEVMSELLELQLKYINERLGYFVDIILIIEREH